MCHKGTSRRLFGLAAGLLLVAAATAQTLQNPDWRRVGGPSADLALASPATGPVDSVWFSPDGSRLYARTRSGGTLETQDYENWVPVSAPPEAPVVAPAFAERLPETAARLVSFPFSRGRVYALGEQLYRSDDGGHSWTDLTAFRSSSVIGAPQHSLAVSPGDGNEIVVANDFGVWRSMDGGLSWNGLNQFLPNLPAARILATPRGMRGTRIYAGGLGTLELRPGTTVWQPAQDSTLSIEEQAERRYAAALGAEITAVAAVGDTVYAGAFDGRIWVSLDGGTTWGPPSRATGGVVERLYADPTEPRVALAALSGPGPLVLRTTNNGGFWDDLSSALPASAARAVTADRASSAIYAATDRGVFYAHADLENPGNPQVQWTSLTGSLPAAGAWDARLDPAGNQLYIVLQGYGVYAALAPHRSAVLRLVSAADLAARPAAPGSLVSVLGGRVTAARAGTLPYPVLAATDAQSQIQVPFEATGPSVALALQTSRGAVELPLAVQPVAPAIFVGRDGGAMLLDADTGLMLDARNTAHSGTRIQVLATGLGKVVPDWPSGLAAPLDNPPAVAASVKAYLDRAPVTVTRAVLAPGYVGLYLVEIQVPELVNYGSAELYIGAGAQESNRVQIFLEP